VQPVSGHEAELTYASSASTQSPSPHSSFSPSRPLDPQRDLISPVSSLSIGSSQARRARRNRGSSDDSGEPDYDGFVTKDFRVGGPYLCPYPANQLPVSPTHPLYDRLDREQGRLTQRISEILQQFNVSWDTIGFRGLQPVRRPEARLVTTVLISAERQTPNDNWLSATRAVYGYMRSEDLASVSVEITDTRAYKRRTCSPVYPADEIFSKWKSVYETILARIDTRDVNALECFRYGWDEDPVKNPPTIIISVRRGSRANWKPVREQVVEILNGLRLLSVAVCVMENEIIRSVELEGSLPDDGCQQKAQAGFSLGIDQESTGTGTFGGFIEVKFSGTNRWQKLGLTCFHCVHEGRTGRTDRETERKY
jgi:hypothetical protein